MLPVSSVVNSKIPAAFDPVGAFLVWRAELARGWGVDALGEETLEDLGVPEFVELLQEILHRLRGVTKMASECLCRNRIPTGFAIFRLLHPSKN